MSWTIIITINLVVFFSILLGSEIAIRLVWTVKTCFVSDCNLTRIKNVSLWNIFTSKYIGISRFDKELGYIPKEGFDAVIDASGWERKIVTINEDGFRANKASLPYSKEAVLAVGDSFTFGDQVSNDETWPSCLQEKLNVRVDNAGVFGYGAAQSLLRAQHLIGNHKYSSVILSVLVGRHDFQRDRLAYNHGFTKPYLIKKNNIISWAPLSDPYVSGTKYNPKADLAYYWKKYSLLYSYFSDRTGLLPKGNRDRLTLVGKDAANIDEIIPWVLKEFSELSVGEKILLLQYPRNLESKHVVSERKLIVDTASLLSNLIVVDTFDRLLREDKKRLWNGHHTYFGNQVVCHTLVSQAFKEE